jgi:acyl carrier protein
MTATETRHRDFSPVLRSLRAEALDCIQANLAVLADQHGGAGAHLALGAPLRFPLDSSPEARLAEASELAGIRVAQRWSGVDGARLRQLSEDQGLLYVVADAYQLPWLPYAGKQHMEHSFLLTPAASPTVVDAYHNETQWGEIRPGVWRLEELTLTNATAYVLGVQPVKLDVSNVVVTNAAEMTAALPAIESYLAGFELAQLVLDVWLLARSRQLHAAWLASVGLPADEAERQAQDWLAFAGQTYLAMRRAERGGPVAPVDVELRRLLHGDVGLARRLADELVRDAVTEALSTVLRVPDTEVQDQRPLRELPNYNSFRLLDVIDRVEQRLGLQLDPAALTADNLRDPASLRRLFTVGRS